MSHDHLLPLSFSSLSVPTDKMKTIIVSIPLGEFIQQCLVYGKHSVNVSQHSVTTLMVWHRKQWWNIGGEVSVMPLPCGVLPWTAQLTEV